MDFKISGKFIISYSEFYTQKAYYIASLSDEIILHPDGMFIFNGFSKTVIFYRSFFKGVGIKPVIFRIGKYKSATEPFLYNFMSKFSKLQDSLLLFSFYNHFINEISDNRSIDINYLKNISKSLLISTAEDAYKFKFVTKIGYFDEVKLILMNNFSVDHLVEYISLNDYSNYIKFRNFNLSKNKVVILIAEGDIIDGKSSSYSVGSRDFVNVIKKIREDDSIKALVLRINSPGGSSIASENI
jgi:protease-4